MLFRGGTRLWSDSSIMADVTVIVVTWNSSEFIERCLSSIHSSRGKIDCRVVVVDNRSEDETLKLVRSRYPAVEVIENRTNVGFAAANNQALRTIETRYAFLLNPDAELLEGSLPAMVEFMEATPAAWAAGAALVNPDESPQQYGVRFPTAWNILCESFFLDRLFPRSRLVARHKELYKDQTRPRAVDFVQGAALIVRADAVNAVGGLDEQFFMYFEESDWCFRMMQAGGKIYFVPQAHVRHHGGAPGHYDERRLVHYHRSLFLFLQKHYSFFPRAVMRLLIAVRSVVRLLVWAAVWVVSPGMRNAARSSLAGYGKVIVLSCGAV